MPSSLEHIEYLSRSPSRVQVLDAIHEAPQSQRDLRELTDVSRVTLSRTLANFEDRGWVERTNGVYETTPEGAYVATEVTRLLSNLDAAASLDGVMAWLPTDEFDFPLTCLREAEVSTSSWGDHTAQIRHVAEHIPGSDRIEATASGVSREVVDALWEATVNGDTSFEAILDTTALDIIRTDADLREQHREMIGAGAKVRRYEGDRAPLLMVMVCDDTVILCGHDEDGPPPGTLESTHEQVRSWAETYIDAVRDDARPLGDEAFTD